MFPDHVIIAKTKISNVAECYDERCFLYLFKLILSKKLSLKGAFWHFKGIKIISRKQAANAAHQKIDNSRVCVTKIKPK